MDRQNPNTQLQPLAVNRDYLLKALTSIDILGDADRERIRALWVGVDGDVDAAFEFVKKTIWLLNNHDQVPAIVNECALRLIDRWPTIRATYGRDILAAFQIAYAPGKEPAKK